MFQIEFDTKQIESALPDYKYIKRLGSGAFAVVHLVENRQTAQKLALKKINCFGMSQYQKAGAANQVRILSSLQHKNITKVKSCLFDNNEDVMYTFMQYAQYGDLNAFIQQAKQKKKRIPQSTIWKIISDIADGLNYLHRNQIMHRDIKPANIFRMGSNFKIGDMNVSKIMKNGIAACTKTGSPLYTAPEVWNAEEYSYQADIWSLGILVYQLCCLKVPFQADSILQLIKKIKQQKIKNIPTFYSSTLDETIKKMLQAAPSKRITTQQIIKIASSKLKLETQGLEDNQLDYLMNTIVFPDTHQRWVNLIPPTLPPKTNRKQSVTKTQTQEQVRSKSKDKNQKNEQVQLMIVSRNGFKINQRKPQIHSKSRGKADPKNQQLKAHPPANLPPIYRSNSPVAIRKKACQKLQKSIERRQNLSNSRSKRQSAIQLVAQSKSLINNA